MNFTERWTRLRCGIASVSEPVEHFLKRRGIWLLTLFAVVYYALYYNAHLTLTGEAGSNVLIAQRILEGWRPIKDMFIGYNLMWFYPLAWIFEFTGPHLLASRIYFMVLCGISGVLGFFMVRRVTGSGTLAVLAGGLMILMPGAMYRNTVGFVGTLASFALVFGYVVLHRSWLSKVLWMGFAGAAMSLCFLIRIEPSLIASIVWAGLVFLYPFIDRREFVSRLRIVLAGTSLGVVAFAAVHAPFVVHAYERGFGPEFTGQYRQFVKLLRWELQREVQKIWVLSPKAAPVQPAPSAPILSVESTPAANPSMAIDSPPKPADSTDGRRQRPAFSESFQKGRISFLPLSIYLPVLSTSVLAVFGLALFLSGAVAGVPRRSESGLSILATTGCALSLFPQYFFFRPDSVHLAEFMVPFYPALACAAAAAIAMRAKGWRGFSSIVILLAVSLQVVVAFNSLFGRDGSGSIRISKGKTALFEAPGGIRFRVNPAELGDWERLRDKLAAATCEGDFLVTYPYVPLLNVMAESPTYQFKLYVDNATEASDFAEKTIRELQENRPAIVVVNNRDINKSEISRFRNWAAPVHAFLLQEYVLSGTFFEKIEVFVRPDRAEDALR